MKRWWIIGLCLTIWLSACAPAAYESMESVDGGVGIRWGDRTYEFYGPVPDVERLRGAQLGIIDGDRDWKVYAVNGQSTEEWLIEYYDVIMSTYALYRAQGVEDEWPESAQSEGMR